VHERKTFSRKIAPFLEGASYLFGFKRKHPFLEISDADAIKSDWEKVGNYIKQATEKFADENMIEKAKD
jgi:hypothetical protein